MSMRKKREIVLNDCSTTTAQDKVSPQHRRRQSRTGTCSPRLNPLPDPIQKINPIVSRVFKIMSRETDAQAPEGNASV
jgi:hypothetical protein